MRAVFGGDLLGEVVMRSQLGWSGAIGNNEQSVNVLCKWRRTCAMDSVAQSAAREGFAMFYAEPGVRPGGRAAFLPLCK